MVIDKIRDSEGKWLDSSVFRKEALKFKTNSYYCSDPQGSPSFTEYWDEQLERCKKGYSVGGHKITGHHYEYLNFTQIKIVKVGDVDSDEESEDDIEQLVASKKTTCPDFWDGDYDYFWCVDIARYGLFTSKAQATSQLEKEVYKTLPLEQQKEEKQRVLKRLGLKVIPHPDYLDGGNHMIIGKSRRKGYSYKNASICVNTYNTIRESLTVIGAYDKKYLYPKGTMGMVSKYMSFLNKYTAWSKAREFVNKQEHKKASFKETTNGVEVEAGYQSEVVALTFADNSDAARGTDAEYVLFEEAGVFPNLKASHNATKPSLEGGSYITGQILIFGTGGDMESGTVDFAEMFYSPIQFGLMPFLNIWDENAELTYCGFFHPVYMNMEGYYDAQGNSDTKGALAHEMAIRDRLIKASTSSNIIQTRVQEYPTCPAEAFLTVSTNDFPIAELRNQYNKVIREKLHIKQGQPCTLERIFYDDKEHNNLILGPSANSPAYRPKIKAIPDLENKIQILWDYKPKSKNLDGGVVIYEYPDYNTPRGLYKIGFDPYRQEQSNASHGVPSIAVIYVYKCVQRGSFTKNQIVACYAGRPYSPDSVNRTAEMLAELYNAEIMHENEVTHVKSYFDKRKKLHLLAAQPDAVISKNIKDSKVARVFGIHMVDKLKDAGEKYIKAWLLEERDFDENGNVVLNLDLIYDPALLEELILYNRKGNFDRVMALMMVMFQIEEQELNKEYDTEVNTSLRDDFRELMETQYK